MSEQRIWLVRVVNNEPRVFENFVEAAKYAQGYGRNATVCEYVPAILDEVSKKRRVQTA
jgi:hypothetical protein